jgi:hypothetical protein
VVCVTRPWIVHEHPSLLKVTGAELQDQFRPGGELKEAVVSAIVRQLQSQETAMYLNQGCTSR